jgi:cell division protein FtsL
MNLTPYFVSWIVLGVVVGVLAIAHFRVAGREDASIHMLESTGEAEQQQVMNQEISKIDHWGKILTLVLVVYGIILAGIYIYQSWVQTSKIQP